jgi:three-Cys-motif partner protein
MTQDLPEVGPWAREKLNGLRAYMSAYMKILSKRASLRTVYVDAFAAAGRAVVRKKEHEDPTIHLDLGEEARDEDSREVLDGSPRVALEIEPPFEQYVVIEADKRRLAELKDLEAQYGDRRKIAVRSGDCNTYCVRAAARDSRRRGVRRARGASRSLRGRVDGSRGTMAGRWTLGPSSTSGRRLAPPSTRTRRVS